jgi:hypothetical protein
MNATNIPVLKLRSTLRRPGTEIGCGEVVPPFRTNLDRPSIYDIDAAVWHPPKGHCPVTLYYLSSLPPCMVCLGELQQPCSYG